GEAIIEHALHGGSSPSGAGLSGKAVNVAQVTYQIHADRLASCAGVRAGSSALMPERPKPLRGGGGVTSRVPPRGAVDAGTKPARTPANTSVAERDEQKSPPSYGLRVEPCRLASALRRLSLAGSPALMTADVKA